MFATSSWNRSPHSLRQIRASAEKPGGTTVPAHRATTIALHIALGAVVISTIIPASLVLFADATGPSWLAPTQLLTASALLTILARTRHD